VSLQSHEAATASWSVETYKEFLTVYCDGFIVAEAIRSSEGWVSLIKARAALPPSLDVPSGFREAVSQP
jgi:hypothetical protein